MIIMNPANQKIELLERREYWTQRNNRFDDPSTPGHERWIACFPTAAVMWYVAGGHKGELDRANTSGWDHDDWFMSLLRSDDAWKKARAKYGNLVTDGYAPNEIHGMYHSYLEPVVFGRRLSDFVDPMRFEDFVTEIRDKRRPVLTSGRYQSIMFGAIAGHVSVATGITEDGALLFSDPLGDPWSLYESAAGYEIKYERWRFDAHIKQWGHVFL